MVDESSVVKNNGAAHWRECEYTYDGATWRKRFYAVTLLSTKSLALQYHFALFAQCSAVRRTAMFELSDRWVAALGSEDWRESADRPVQGHGLPWINYGTIQFRK